MWKMNLKIFATVVGTLAVYTMVANVIPQVESEVPEAVEVSADLSTEELVAMGEELFHGAGGCEACHGLGTRAPDLIGTAGATCGDRKPDMGCKAYLHESLTEPGAYVVEGFQPIMPSIARTLSGGQVWALVAFLQSQGGEVTVTSGDLAAAGGASGGAGNASGSAGASGSAPAAGGASGAAVEATEPPEIMRGYGCVACHALEEGEGGAVGPPVAEIRAAGHPPDYLRRSILAPLADTASGYEALVGTMPPNFGDRMTAGQLETLVRFLGGGGG